MRADQFEPLDAETLARWDNFGRWEGRTYFPSLLGLTIDELRTDYCRMRLPYKPEHEQPAGVVHGGALASLVDTVVVPAIGQAYEPDVRFMTLSMNINYIGAVVQQDVIAEGWVTRRGRSTVFCQVEATAGGNLVLDGSLIYAVRHPRA